MSTVVPSPSPFLKPSQRTSRATLPTSWLMQAALVTPRLCIFTPPPMPASYSVWPTWSMTPRPLATSLPEFIEITGIPAATAALIDLPSASASGIETTSPSGLLATAASTSWAIVTMSKVSGARYSTVRSGKSLAASSTPRLATDQKPEAA